MSLPAEVSELLLDSWPVLEWLKGRQPTASVFRAMIDAAFTGHIALSMCRMNYGEVIYSIRKDFPSVLVEPGLKGFLELPIRFYSVDDLLVDEAAVLKSRNRMSYADAFAAALSLRLHLPLVTGDPDFIKLQDIGLKLHWVGA